MSWTQFVIYGWIVLLNGPQVRCQFNVDMDGNGFRGVKCSNELWKIIRNILGYAKASFERYQYLVLLICSLPQTTSNLSKNFGYPSNNVFVLTRFLPFYCCYLFVFDRLTRCLFPFVSLTFRLHKKRRHIRNRFVLLPPSTRR